MLPRILALGLACLAAVLPAQSANAGKKTRAARDLPVAAQRAAAVQGKVSEGEFRSACGRDKCLHVDAKGKPL